MSSKDDFPIFEFNPYKLPTDYHSALGLVTACSAQTENVVEMAVAIFAQTDLIRGAAISTHMSAPLRDGVVRSLAQLSDLPVDALDELDAILDRINTAFAKRNTYVRNTWGQDLSTKEVFYVRASAKSNVSMNPIPVPLVNLQEDATEIYNAGMALMTFFNERNLSPREPTIPANFRDRGRKARKKGKMC